MRKCITDVVTVLFFVILTACSKGTSEPTAAVGQSAAPGGEVAATMPTESAQAPAAEASGAPASLAEVPEHEGVITELIDVPQSKTMYIKVESEGTRIWLATKGMDVKVGDTLRYGIGDAVVMENFASRALDRTFDKVLLVSNVQKVNP